MYLFNQRTKIKFMLNNFIYILRPKKRWTERIDSGTKVPTAVVMNRGEEREPYTEV